MNIQVTIPERYSEKGKGYFFSIFDVKIGEINLPINLDEARELERQLHNRIREFENDLVNTPCSSCGACGEDIVSNKVFCSRCAEEAIRWASIFTE